MQPLVFIFLLLNLNYGMDVFDCSLNPRNIKTWDLTERGPCKDPEEQFEKETNVTVQVIKNEERRYQIVWKCQLFQTVTATRCGFDSLTYNSFELETAAPVIMTPGDCRRLIKTKKMSMYHEEWEFSSLQHFSFDADIIGKYSILSILSSIMHENNFIEGIFLLN